MGNIIVVDKDDNQIGVKDRESITYEDIYRVSSLWITNSKGEILLALRNRNKTHHPLKWGPSVAGTIDEGETYEVNILKEASEELGLNIDNPITGPKIYNDDDYQNFVQWYFLTDNLEISDLDLQEDEVEEARWWGVEELKKEVKENPQNFVPSIVSSLVKILAFNA